MSEEDSTHDQLIQAYLDYFKANEWWERKESIRAYAAVQQQVKKIKNLAKARNDEIRHKYQAADPERRKNTHLRNK